MSKRTAKKESTVRAFSSQQLADLEHQISALGGFDATAEWLSTTPEATVGRSEADALHYARTTLKGLRDPGKPHDARYRNILALIMRDGGKPQSERAGRVVAQTVEVVPVAIDPTPRSTGPSEFQFNGRKVRMVLDDIGEPMFVGRDLVLAVGSEWKGTSGTLAHIPEDFRGVRSVQTPSGVQEMVCLYEAGLNMYLFRSDKPAALPWQRFLAEEVLPQIRKTGRYERPGTVPQLPSGGIDTAALLQSIASTVATAVAAAVPAIVAAIGSSKPEPISRTSKSKSKTTSEELDFDGQKDQRGRYNNLVITLANRREESGEQLGDRIASVHHEVWDLMINDYGVDAELEARRESLLQAKDISVLEWICQHGHLMTAIKCALKLSETNPPPHMRAVK